MKEVPVLYVLAAATELYKTQVCYEYGYAQGRYYRYRTLPTRRLKRITIPKVGICFELHTTMLESRRADA